MIYILFLVLICLFIISYILANRNILSPTVIVCAVFIVSTLFAILNIETWQFTLSSITVIVITAGICFFALGEFTTKYTCDKHRYEETFTFPKKAIEVPPLLTLIIILILVIMAGYFFYETYQASLAGGNPGGLKLMLKYARKAQLQRLYRMNRLSGHFNIFAKAVFIIYAYIFFCNVVYTGFKWKWLALTPPIFMYIPFILMSTGRTQLMYWMLTILLFYLILYLSSVNWEPIYNIKIVFIAIFALVALFALFTMAGYLTGKSQTKGTYDIISFYTGMSIPSLDYYLLNPLPESTMIGNNTLFPIYSTLRNLGFNLPDLYAPYEFVTFNETTGNVYTALRRYIQDYSFLGMLIIMFLLGSIYYFLFRKASQKQGFWLVIYATFSYPIFEMSIEERFLMNIVSTSTIYLLIYLAIMYYFMIHKQQSQKLKENSSAQEIKGAIQ